jgi:hypothetical protein
VVNEREKKDVPRSSRRHLLRHPSFHQISRGGLSNKQKKITPSFAPFGSQYANICITDLQKRKEKDPPS